MGIIDQMFPRRGRMSSGAEQAGILISGSESAGPELVSQYIVTECIDAGRMLIILDGKQTAEEQSWLVGYLRAKMTGGRLGYLFNDRPDTDSIDVLSVFSDDETMAEYLAFLMMMGGVKEEEKDNLAFYYALILRLFRSAGKKASLKDVLSLDPDSLAAKIDSSTHFSADEKENIRIFLEGMRTVYVRSMISAARVFISGNLGKALNGSLRFRNMIKPGNVWIISIPASGHSTPFMKDEGIRRYRTLYTFSSLISHGIQNAASLRTPVTILIRHCDLLPEETMKDLLSLCGSYPVQVIWFPEDIADYTSKHGVEVLKGVPFRAVFREEDQTSAEFWEKQFGHEEKTEMTTSFTPKKQKFGFTAFMNTGGFAMNPLRRGTVTYGMSKKDKPNCPAEKFRRLKNGEALCYYAELGRFFPVRVT